MARTRMHRLGEIERKILEDLSMGDLLIGFLCSAHSTRQMYKVARERAMRRYRTRQAVERLVQEGHIRRRHDMLSISETGRQLLDRTASRLRDSLHNKRWDGKWRIITFDIPELLRRSRDSIRAVLKRAGFMQLQQSTWVFPHDCEELSLLIKQDKRLSECVLYGVLERIENDLHLRKKFSLA